MNSAVAWSPNILTWLEAILEERYGQRFILQSVHSKQTRVLLEGDVGSILIAADPEIFTQASSQLPHTEWDSEGEGWDYPIKTRLPAPGADCLPQPLITKSEQGYTVGYDILGLTYWMLSRQEEVGRTDLDEYSRFPATSSHAFKFSYLDRPVVDEWLYILGQVVERVWPQITLRTHQFTVKVSHDVDHPSRYLFRDGIGFARAMIGDVVKRRNFSSMVYAPLVRFRSSDRVHPADPYNTFEWIMDISERHGLTSAFYFICGRTDREKDADYDLEHPAIRALIRRIHFRGHEIGLHPSFNSYRSPEIIKEEAERLWKVCAQEGVSQTEWGGRMHYLRWEQPTTLQAWDDANLTYDSTLSYADLPGFRCGTCHEYPGFNPVTREQLSLRIRPLIAMECSVISERYKGFGTGEKALSEFRLLRERCANVHGCFTLLWHNSELHTTALRDLYQNVLE